MTSPSPVTPSPRSLLIEPSFDLPLVSIAVAVRMGALADPPGREGATRLMARLMRRSGGGRSAEAIDTEVDSLGGSISVDVSASTIVFHATVIARSLERFAALLADILTRPALGEDELERLKRETAAELVESLDDDRSLVRRWFRRKFYGEHPYARPLSGTPKTLSRIDADVVRSQYRKLFVPENLVVAVSGHIGETEAQALAERLVGALPSGAAAVDDTREPDALDGRRLVLVDKPERTQTQILIGGLGSQPSDPDHFPLLVANTAFGGTFTARLMQEIRAKRGWSYGAYSSLPYDRRRQAYSLWTFPKADDAPACIQLELEMLEALSEKGISKAELAWSKRYLVRSHAFAIDTANKRVGLALDAELYGLPPGYFERYTSLIKAVRVEEANQALKERLSSEQLLVTVVGTAGQIGEKVREAIPRLAHHEIVPYDAE